MPLSFITLVLKKILVSNFSTMKNFLLSETNYRDIMDMPVDLVILPWGATEAHNLHLPYSTDTIESAYIAEEAAKKATLAGSKVMVLPAIPYGVNTGQSDIRFCMNINPSTQYSILTDLITTLYNQGVRKFLVINGHGGNDFIPLLREAGARFPGMILVSANWFEAVEKDNYFDNAGNHADEMETSIMLAISPDLVLPLSEAGLGESKRFTVKCLNEKWAWSERKWSQVTRDTGIGNPTLATREKGLKYLEAVIAKVAILIEELACTDTGNFYSE